MFIDIRSRRDEAEIQELLGWAVFPDPERLKQAAAQYAELPYKLYGYEAEGEIVGLIGYHAVNSDTVAIDHIAVTPAERCKGYGRGLILELLELEKPAMLVAETDEEAADFYRSSRFTVESLGELYPGTERFRCTYYAEDEE